MANLKNKRKLWLERLMQLHEESPDYVIGHVLDLKGQINNELSIDQWVNKAKAVGYSYKQKGVQPGDRVVLSLPTSEEFLINFLALWWVGAIPVPLPEPSPRLKSGTYLERLQHVMQDCQPKGFVVLEDGKKILSDIKEFDSFAKNVTVMSAEELWDNGQQCDWDLMKQPAIAEADECAFIQYTSGSTGNPKGVMVTHGSLVANILAMGEASEMSKDDRFLSWIPLYHDMGLIGGILFPTYFQTKYYVISPFYFLANPAVWLQAISDHQITLSSGPNFAYNLCARRIDPSKLRDLNLSSWRLAYNGSEPVDAFTLAAFYKTYSPYGFNKTSFYPVYGMAEATLAITFPNPGKETHIDYVDRRELMENSKAVPVEAKSKNSMAYVGLGPCLPDHKIEIVDLESDKVLGEREVGEICFIGGSVTPGYFHQREQLPNDRQRLHTGDLGYVADGQIYIVDRLKNLIQIAGVNYYPSDIERQVQKVEGVRPSRVVALGIFDRDMGTSSLVILAEVAKEDGYEAIVNQIKDSVYEKFNLVPSDIVLLPPKGIPLTSSGKLMHRKCKEMYEMNQFKRIVCSKLD